MDLNMRCVFTAVYQTQILHILLINTSTADIAGSAYKYFGVKSSDVVRAERISGSCKGGHVVWVKVRTEEQGSGRRCAADSTLAVSCFG